MGFELTTLEVIVTDCMGSYKSNYHTIVNLEFHLYIVLFFVKNKFDDTKGVTRSRKSEQDRQHNDQHDTKGVIRSRKSEKARQDNDQHDVKGVIRSRMSEKDRQHNDQHDTKGVIRSVTQRGTDYTMTNMIPKG